MNLEFSTRLNEESAINIVTPAKIKVKSIKIEWAESFLVPSEGIEFSTFKEAQTLIDSLAIEKGEMGGYCKTGFTITWEDGRKHEGRIDLKRKNAMESNSIGKHVKEYYEHLALTKRVIHWTMEEQENYVRNIAKANPAEMLEVLNKYEFEDIEEVTPEPTEQPENGLTEFVDVSNFTINETTERRLISTSMFSGKRDIGNETKALQTTLSELQESTKQVIELTDKPDNKNKLIEGYNAFCERYTRELNDYLSTKSLSPSWTVTGRGGLNVSRYNKKQDRVNSKMLKVVEMLDKQNKILNKYKKRFKTENIAVRNESIGQLGSSSIDFKTSKRELHYYGLTYNSRSYNSPNYFFMKMAGCYRVFEKSTGKEVYAAKTTSKLDDVKKHVVYLEQSKLAETV